MKNFFLPLILIVVLASCKKEYSAYTDPDATISDTSLVKRLVMVDGTDSIAYDFSFNNSRRLIYLYVTEVFGGNYFYSSDTFFRDPVSGNIQRSVYTIYDPSSSSFNYYDTTYYQYWPDGKLQSRLRAQEFSPGYKDSIVLAYYTSGKLKEEVKYSKGPAIVSIERKRIFDVGVLDRLNGITDSVYRESTGVFEWESSDFYLYVDSVNNPLRLKNKEDREVLGFGYYSFNDYPWLNLFSPKVLQKETYQSIYSSGTLTFDFSPYQVLSGRPIRAEGNKSSSGGSSTIEVRYYYSD